MLQHYATPTLGAEEDTGTLSYFDLLVTFFLFFWDLSSYIILQQLQDERRNNSLWTRRRPFRLPLGLWSAESSSSSSSESESSSSSEQDEEDSDTRE